VLAEAKELAAKTVDEPVVVHVFSDGATGKVTR